MPLRNTAEHYGSLAKFLHWSIVILIIAQYFLAEIAHDLPKGPEALAWMTRHKSIGMLILLLAIARIGWRLANKGLPTPIGEGFLKKAASAGHGLLYLLILAIPLSGWAMTSAANGPVPFFGLFEFPAIVGENHDLHEALEEVHEALFNAVFILAVGHALAALYHHFILKDSTLRRMLP
jgi:cytochrome b561